MSTVRMGRAFSPDNRLGNPTQGVALGWYETGPLALRIRQTPRANGATSSFFRAKGATSSFFRANGSTPSFFRANGSTPSFFRANGSTPSFFRAKGASPYQPGATPQESNHPTKQRAEGPIHGIGGYEVGQQFRGVTKMILRQIPAARLYQRASSQGFLDYSNRSRVTEDSSATANSAVHGVFTPRSQGKATVKESLTVQIEQMWRGTAEESSVVQTAGGKGIGRAFSPREFISTGLLGRCPRLVWRWAFGPETQTAPTARIHTSLGQRPRFATPTRIEG